MTVRTGVEVDRMLILAENGMVPARWTCCCLETLTAVRLGILFQAMCSETRKGLAGWWLMSHTCADFPREPG